MVRKINNFKKKFPFNLKYSKSNKGVLIGDRTQNDANLRSLLITHILNKEYNYNPYLVSDLNDKKNISVYQNTDIKKFSINLKLTNLNYFFIIISSFFDLTVFYLKTLLMKNKMSWLIKNFKCKKINIGDLVYDLYVRYDFKFLKPSIYEIKFLITLYKGILKTHFIDYLVNKYRIKMVVSTQMSFTSYGNIMLRYGTKFGLKSFVTGSNLLQKFNNHKETLTSHFKVREKNIKKNIKLVSGKEIENFYDLRKKGNLHGTYVPINTIKKVYGLNENNKILEFANKLSKIKKSRQINLFAVHCFSDSPHFCADIVFQDYYDQFLQTINFIRKNNKNTFWIIKPHPARSQYHEDGLIENVIKRYKSELDNLVICPEKINNSTLFNLSDNLINCVSTISLEFACHGKKSIIAGDAPYYQKGLFFKPKTRESYFNLINNLHKLKTNLNKQEILLSKRILYLIELEANNNLDKSKILPDIFLSNLSEDSYVKCLNQNFKKELNFSILEDPLYKSLELKLSKTII